MTSSVEGKETFGTAPVGKQEIRFLRAGRIQTLRGFRPSLTVLEYLREICGAIGTKEGCAEGDCGACTVVVGTPGDGRINYRAVNSCIQLVGSLDGKELITVEDLAEDGVLHPVQEAMVRLHGSQCGFCTPGFLMALFALLHRDDRDQLTRQRVTDAIAGNLCRCTGYRPIVDAAFSACGDIPRDQFVKRNKDSLKALSRLDPAAHIFVGDETTFFAAPSDEDVLARLLMDHPDATLVAGATDVGLWVTKQLRDLKKIIYLGRVLGMNNCSVEADSIRIGAACTYTDAFQAMALIDPDIGELLRRLGSDQIRNAGTVGGNIANGSPIGDTPPVLIALGASIELRRGQNVRSVALEDFFLDYGKQDRQASEYLRTIHVPKLANDSAFRCFKIAKRFDQDISSVLGAFHIRLNGRKIGSARIAFGGMAATPRRATRCEAAIKNCSLDDRESWRAALDELSKDFSPMTDHRASANYRDRVARALFEKALIEISGEQNATRLVGHRETVDA